jgi:hypothetical protein
MVAIKILTSADPSRIARLEREARAISRVSHSHICALHDIGRQDSLAYLVMEYLVQRSARENPSPSNAERSVDAESRRVSARGGCKLWTTVRA